MEEKLNINGNSFELVKAQREGISAVYKGEQTYLRIGDKTKIVRDIENHRKMEGAGFPVAHIIEEGEYEGMRYFIETSLGEQTLGSLFAQDIKTQGYITDEHFSTFVSIATTLAKAQMYTKTVSADFDAFARAIHLDILQEELPQHKDTLRDIFTEVSNRLSVFPFVLTHGDFNPHNIYPDGVIDFEDSFEGPFGYDVVGALVHIDYFPDSQEYEYFAKYRFNQNQRESYLKAIDAVSQDAGLPKFSEHISDFEFCRAVWSLVRMQKWPKLQQFRYDLFTERFLK